MRLPRSRCGLSDDREDRSQRSPTPWRVEGRSANAGGPARARQPSGKVRGGAAPPMSAGDRRRHPRSKYRSHCLARQTHLPREREKPGVDRTRVPRPAKYPLPHGGKGQGEGKRPALRPSPEGKGQGDKGDSPLCPLSLDGRGPRVRVISQGAEAARTRQSANRKETAQG